MEFKIENIKVYGLDKAIKASGNSFKPYKLDNTPVNEKDLLRASKLAKTGLGEGHDSWLVGIIVQFDVYAPLYWWKQLQRYHFVDFMSSQSTMHNLVTKNPDLQFNLQEHCNGYVYSYLLEDINKLIKQYKDCEDEELKDELYQMIISNLPCGFILGASMTTNYRQLKTIYQQRKDHRLREWREFCRFIKDLPYSEWITGEEYGQTQNN